MMSAGIDLPSSERNVRWMSPLAMANLCHIGQVLRIILNFKHDSACLKAACNR